MNIVIVTQNAPLYLAQFLDDFLGRITKTSHTVKSIVVLSSYVQKGIMSELGERYRCYGFILFIRLMFRILKRKILSLIAYFHSGLGCHSVDNVTRKYRVDKHKTYSVNSEDFLEYININRVDLIVSIAAPMKFKREILNATGSGCINYHTALLPKYRGRQPLFWALLNEEKEVGISIHEMDEQFDSGPIVVQDKIRVDANDTLHSLYLRTIKMGPQLMIEAIGKLDRGCKYRIENNPEKATYNKFPTREDVRLFRSRRKRFF